MKINQLINVVLLTSIHFGWSRGVLKASTDAGGLPEQLTTVTEKPKAWNCFSKQFIEKFKINLQPGFLSLDSDPQRIVPFCFHGTGSHLEDIKKLITWFLMEESQSWNNYIATHPDQVHSGNYFSEALLCELAVACGRNIIFFEVGNGVKFKPDFFEKLTVVNSNGQKVMTAQGGWFDDEKIVNALDNEDFCRLFIQGDQTMAFIYHKGLEKVFYCAISEANNPDIQFVENPLLNASARSIDEAIANRLCSKFTVKLLNILAAEPIKIKLVHEVLPINVQQVKNLGLLSVVWAFLLAKSLEKPYENLTYSDLAEIIIADHSNRTQGEIIWFNKINGFRNCEQFQQLRTSHIKCRENAYINGIEMVIYFTKLYRQELVNQGIIRQEYPIGKLLQKIAIFDCVQKSENLPELLELVRKSAQKVVEIFENKGKLNNGQLDDINGYFNGLAQYFRYNWRKTITWQDIVNFDDSNTYMKNLRIRFIDLAYKCTKIENSRQENQKKINDYFTKLRQYFGREAGNPFDEFKYLDNILFLQEITQFDAKRQANGLQTLLDLLREVIPALNAMRQPKSMKSTYNRLKMVMGPVFEYFQQFAQFCGRKIKKSLANFIYAIGVLSVPGYEKLDKVNLENAFPIALAYGYLEELRRPEMEQLKEEFERQMAEETEAQRLEAQGREAFERQMAEEAEAQRLETQRQEAFERQIAEQQRQEKERQERAQFEAPERAERRQRMKQKQEMQGRQKIKAQKQEIQWKQQDRSAKHRELPKKNK